MNRILRLAYLQRIVKFRQQSKRLSHNDHGHHHAFNPGPPITLDYMPIPHQSFQNVTDKLNKKFNFYIAVCKFVKNKILEKITWKFIMISNWSLIFFIFSHFLD